jgi:hypothetical protein
MRTVAWPFVSSDDPDNPATYEFAVPYPALALPVRYGAIVNPTMEVVSFCKERGIRLPLRSRWHPEGRTTERGRGFKVDILVFETVEDQPTVAQAFPGRLC